MPQLKKILISLPEALLCEIDEIAADKGISRSKLINEVLRLYSDKRKKCRLEEQMIKGYQEMGEINLKLAEMCFEGNED